MCLWISNTSEETSKCSGREGKRGAVPSIPGASGWGGVRDMVSSEAAVKWIPLESESLDLDSDSGV